MSDEMPRAKRIGLLHVRTWLPDGRQEGDEWVALNPTRSDEHLGSFRFNTVTGEWCDFARPDEARGKDAVSLYAYLNYSRLGEVARSKNYKNINSGIQVEAAREILTIHDDTYFPDDNDRFIEPSNPKAGYWDGWRYMEKGIEQPPELDTSWYEEKWGEKSNTWEFRREGRIVLYVCRFLKNGKKDDRPFTLWTDGQDFRWRAKAPQGKYPLWNQDKLNDNPNGKVLLCEGQKVPSVLDPILTNYICTGWYGGTNAIDKQDWEPLRGREIWYAFDGDSPGRKSLAKMRNIIAEYDIKIHIIYPPAGVKRGWDLADAVEKGWTEEQIEEHIDKAVAGGNGRLPTGQGSYDFEILGCSGEHIYFYPHGSRKITKIKSAALTKNALMTLQDRGQYSDIATKPDGGIFWDAVANHILRIAEEKPIFSMSRSRGTGVWRDNGTVVINTGEYLYVDGERRELYESPSDYVYERGRFVPYMAEDAITVDESKKLIELLRLINWKRDIYADIFAGWLTLAPFGGALHWRPYVWITGPTGTGKSWILDNIANHLVGKEFGIYAQGTSTPAGVRNKLSNNSLATIIDEMEGDNPKYAENIDQNLRMFREGSSGTGDGAVTLHGTSDGEGREWIVQSMALFASVGAAIKYGADKTRFTEITLSGSEIYRDIRQLEKRFAELEDQARIITPAWSRAYHARTYKLFAEVERCIVVMTHQATEILKNRRYGDQIGTLLAGAWMSNHDKAITAAEAKQYLELIDMEQLVGDNSKKTDEELVLDEILSSRIELVTDRGNARHTIGSVLTYWYKSHMALSSYEVMDIPGLSEEYAKKELEQYGLKPQSDGESHRLQIAIAHPAIRRMLKDTPWYSTYDTLLSRLPFCIEEIKGPSRFAGISKRYRELDAAEIFDEVPF